MGEQIVIKILTMFGYVVGWLFRLLFDGIVYLIKFAFMKYKTAPKQFQISSDARFAHTQIVAGSGHGKTQLLQQLFLRDLPALKQGTCSVIIIDSQGDMIHNISHLAAMQDLS